MRFLIFLIISISAFAGENNLHLIEQDIDTGFSIYRTSRPSYEDIEELCKIGVQEIAVLSGDAEQREFKYQSACPGLKVVYNTKQSAKEPLSKSFLVWFDSWVKEAQETGKKIAFRCICGCHRTGRLAAYYQMKYQNLTANDALSIMKKHGKFMIFFKFLDPQVYALKDYIMKRECSKSKEHCVTDL